MHIDISVELDATVNPWTNLQFLGNEELEEFFPDEDIKTSQQGVL